MPFTDYPVAGLIHDCKISIVVLGTNYINEKTIEFVDSVCCVSFSFASDIVDYSYLMLANLRR